MEYVGFLLEVSIGTFGNNDRKFSHPYKIV
jgi:hypothetical protein